MLHDNYFIITKDPYAAPTFLVLTSSFKPFQHSDTSIPPEIGGIEVKN